jgi:AcrR family transcriptional regulator
MVNIMPHIVGTVNMSTRSSAPKPYHHGDLKNAMVDAAVATARLHGPDSVVIRDIARQVGVSHNAAYRHFASRDDLLEAVAEVGLRELAERMQAGLAVVAKRRDPEALARDRLRAIGRAYVEFAVAEPGLFRATWSPLRTPPAAEGPEEDLPLDPYRLLGMVLDEVVSARGFPASRRPFSDIVAWSAVHGLSTLVIDGPLAGLPPEAVNLAIERLCDVVDAGL